MIKASYIHEFSLFDEVEMAIATQEAAVEDSYRRYLTEKNKHDIASFMESEEDNELLEESVGGLVTAVGKAVENACKKVVEMLEKLIDMFNEMMWDRKSDAQKLEVLMNKHPNLKDEIHMAVQKGDIDIKDIKSLQDVMDGSYDILGKLNTGKIDPSEAESRWNKLVDKYHKYGKPIVEVAAGVTTVITAVLAVKTLIPKLAESKKQAIKAKGQLKEWSLQRKLDKMDPENQRAYSSIYTKLCSFVNSHMKGVSSIAKRTDSMLKNGLRKAGLVKTADELKADLDKVKKTNNKYNAILNRGDVKKAVDIEKKKDDYKQNLSAAKQFAKNLATQNDARQQAYGKAMGESDAKRALDNMYSKKDDKKDDKKKTD